MISLMINEFSNTHHISSYIWWLVFLFALFLAALFPSLRLRADENTERAISVREANLYLSPDKNSQKLATVDRGRAYPQVSAIQHAYSQASASGFLVTLTAHFALSYRAGGDWQPLSGTDRTATITYRVQQAVPVVVNQG